MTDRNDLPQMGEFSAELPLELHPFPNGGWTVLQGVGPNMFPNRLGAYTSTSDMLAALNAALK